MKSSDPKRQVLEALGAIIICLGLYKLLGNLIRGMFANFYVAHVVSELFFALLVTIAVFILKRKDVYQADWSLLRQGWSAAGAEYVIIAVCGVLGLSKFENATAVGWEVLVAILFALLVGYCEEVLFRGLLQKALHSWFGEHNGKEVAAAVLLASLVFGLCHITNGLDGTISLGAALYQASVTAMNGVYFGAIYYRTGKNTWFLILLHGLYDFVGLNLGGFLSAQAIKPAPEVDFKRAFLGFLFWAAIYGISTAIILRTKKIEPLLDALEGRN